MQGNDDENDDVAPPHSVSTLTMQQRRRALEYRLQWLFAMPTELGLDQRYDADTLVQQVRTYTEARDMDEATLRALVVDWFRRSVPYEAKEPMDRPVYRKDMGDDDGDGDDGGLGLGIARDNRYRQNRHRDKMAARVWPSAGFCAHCAIPLVVTAPAFLKWPHAAWPTFLCQLCWGCAAPS